ncbi:hypothetical protein LXL04_027584 [Taraxacum kok-saghyz]
MVTKFLSLACIRVTGAAGDGYSRGLSPRPHYPSMPKYPKGVSADMESNIDKSESGALFSVTGMTCSACAGSVEKAVKRLPGIKEAVIDVLCHTPKSVGGNI